MSEAQQTVTNRILSGPRGGKWLRGPFEALLHSPNLAEAVQELGVKIRFESSIPTALNELAILVTARRWTAEFEWHAHRSLALGAGLDEQVIDAIARGAQPRLDADAAAVYVFARQLLEKGTVEDDAWKAVVDRWGKKGVADLIGTVGYYCLVSFILNVDRYPLPDGVAPLAKLPTVATRR
jgi:4-carboxymuconolactone decarboxylase